MKNTIEATETKKIKHYKNEFGVNVLLGFITSLMLVTLICGMSDENSLTQLISRSFALTSLLFQIIPLILSFTILKFTRSQGYWITFYWMTLFVELIILAVGMFYFLT